MAEIAASEIAMEYILSNSNQECLLFTDDFTHIEVLNNTFLPYSLRDCIQTTSTGDFKKSLIDIAMLRDYLSARALDLSRENAKIILNVAAMPQSNRIDDRLKIVLSCRGLTMTDSFWIRKADEHLAFEDVGLRRRSLFEHSYDIAILGKHVPATVEDITSDLMTSGVFPKFWRRTDDKLELWKTDTTNGINAESEVLSSKILSVSEYSDHVRYRSETLDGRMFSVCECFTSDDISFAAASEIKDWCNHTGQSFDGVLAPFEEQLSNMCVIDYVLANMDRGFDNWGVLVSNQNNEIIDFAPLFDMNQCLVSDESQIYINDQIYEPTGMSYWTSAKTLYLSATLHFDEALLPEPCRARWDMLWGCME